MHCLCCSCSNNSSKTSKSRVLKQLLPCSDHHVHYHHELLVSPSNINSINNSKDILEDGKNLDEALIVRVKPAKVRLLNGLYKNALD